jgi:lipopolysaccharide biosynthesis glycosyltransferase
MEVLCACDERYLPHAGTMLCSLLEHNSVFRIHLCYSSIPAPELAKLKSLVGEYGAQIAFYKMIPRQFRDLRVDKHASTAVYYRLLAPRILSPELNKVLYLDCDLIVRRSLTELWNTNLANHALAAVTDYSEDAQAHGLPMGAKYFNSGVLLMNLEFWRQKNVPEQTIAFIANNPEKVPLWDQDALNAILVNEWIELPACWNAQNEAHWLRTSEHTMDPAIVHFITAHKPWHWSNRHPFKPEYHKYRLKTPWRRYKPEGKPRLHSLRRVARVVLPQNLRQWLRSRLVSWGSGRNNAEGIVGEQQASRVFIHGGMLAGGTKTKLFADGHDFTSIDAEDLGHENQKTGTSIKVVGGRPAVAGDQ